MSAAKVPRDAKTRFTEMVKKLRDRGCRVTPQRLAVARILATSEEHPGVEDIFERVKTRFPSTSLATIYKTVNLLKEIGEVVELGLVGDRHRYDGAHPEPHPHLVCIQCQKIIDSDLPGLKDLSDHLARLTGYHVISHRLDFFGVCPGCQEKPRQRPPIPSAGRNKAQK